MKEHHHNWSVFIIVLVVVIIGLILVLFLTKPQAEVQEGPTMVDPIICSEAQCFINAANNCQKAYFETSIKGTMFRLTSENCMITKELMSIASNEPENLHQMFTGKSMICKYQKGNFNPDHIFELTGNLLMCEGPLKDAYLSVLQ